MRKAIEKAEYCHRNPVKRRLVKTADLWRWSSFRWLELGKRDGEPLRIDEWDESLVNLDAPGTALKIESGGTRTAGPKLVGNGDE